MSANNSLNTAEHDVGETDGAASSRGRAWAFLLVASVFEIAFSLGTKGSNGFTVLVPSLIGVVGGVVSVYALTLALRVIDVGIGYTVWTGIGSVGTVVIGSFVFDETITLFKVACFALIIAGVLALHLTSQGEDDPPGERAAQD